jgi:hypothetical protein
MIRVDRITIHHEPDTSPDLSDIGEYSDTPGPDDRTVDRGPQAEARNEYRYFIAAMSPTETGNPDSVRQDYERMEEYRRVAQLMATAPRLLTALEHIIETADAGWDGENLSRHGGRDRDRTAEDRFNAIHNIAAAAVAEVEQEQLEDLKEHLERFGVDTGNWAQAKRR